MHEWVIVIMILAVVGFNTVIWSILGLARWSKHQLPKGKVRRSSRWRAGDVAVLIPAHNEELVIAATLIRATEQFPIEQIFVVSDGSSDRTVQIAQAAGVNVLDLQPNRGKAGAIVAAVEHFDLVRRFEFVMLLDADTHLESKYRRSALAQFTDDDVVAVAGRARTLDPQGARSWLGRSIVWYRERLYTSVQFFHKYGQAARSCNAVTIVPGFASIYRSRVLAEIEIDASGLVIEDYNMTFELHAQQLGRIAFRPDSAIAFTQDPDNLHDYQKQVGRWSLGFWQTVRRHRPRFSLFWAVVTATIVETIFSSVVLLAWLPTFFFSATCAAAVWLGLDATGAGAAVISVLPPGYLLLGLWLPDVALSLLCAVLSQRFGMLQYALLFPAMRFVDAWQSLRALFKAFGPQHDVGRWVSPERRRHSGSIIPRPANYADV